MSTISNWSNRKVSVLSSLYEPLQYPLFFPTGHHGWGLGLKSTAGLKLTQLYYYKHLLLRDVVRCGANAEDVDNEATADVQQLNMLNGFPTTQLRDEQLFGSRRFGRLGRLFNEYVLDMNSRMEDERLGYHNRNQRLICKRTTTEQAIDDMESTGRKILASSFAGGLRYMKEKCANAYALKVKYGIPDVFITFTCNPKVPHVHPKAA